MEVIRYLAERREGKIKRLAQAIIELVALKDHLFIVNAKKKRKCNDHVLLTLGNEAGLCHFLLNVLNIFHLSIKMGILIHTFDHLFEVVIFMCVMIDKGGSESIESA